MHVVSGWGDMFELMRVEQHCGITATGETHVFSHTLTRVQHSATSLSYTYPCAVRIQPQPHTTTTYTHTFTHTRMQANKLPDHSDVNVMRTHVAPSSLTYRAIHHGAYSLSITKSVRAATKRFTNITRMIPPM